MVRFLRTDATHLSDKDIQDIINARNTMKHASEAMATKYKISPRRVYQIWRGEHPPIDTRSLSSFGPREQPTEMIQVSSQELDKFFEKEAERDRKIIQRSLTITKKEPIVEVIPHPL